MNVLEFGKFKSSFCLIQGSCRNVSEEFQLWQQDILREFGYVLHAEVPEGRFSEVLERLYPLTSPIVTKYLFWPLNSDWTLYFDNGKLGSDAGPAAVLASRLETNAIRVGMSDDIVVAETGRIEKYGSTIFEYHQKGLERRHLFSANDGGKWRFGQFGEPFPFEKVDAYKLRSIKERFTHQMLIEYLKELGVDLTGEVSPLVVSGGGYLFTKSRSPQ